MPEITDSLARALDRLDDFQALHGTGSADEQLEAVLCLQEAVGIEDEARCLIRERLYETDGVPTRPTEMLLGMIVGLLAAEFEAEHRSSAEVS